MSYVKYTYYIRSKDTTEYTGIETFIATQLEQEVVPDSNQQKLDWLPKGIAISLSKLAQDADEDAQAADRFLASLQTFNQTLPDSEGAGGH